MQTISIIIQPEDDGKKVKTVEILGSDDAKYLRVNHSRVKESELASFIDAKESKFIYKDTYLKNDNPKNPTVMGLFYRNITGAKIVSDDPDILEPLKFLRQREITHYQRFGEALRLTTDRLNSKNFYAFNPNFDKQTCR